MASTQARRIERKQSNSDEGRVLLAANTIIFQGTMIFLDSGYGVSTTADGANGFAGIATRNGDNRVIAGDNRVGSAGQVSVDVYRSGKFLMNFDAIEQADEGANVYAVDNDTLSLTETDNSFAGVLAEYVSATKGFVDIVVGRRGPQGEPG